MLGTIINYANFVVIDLLTVCAFMVCNKIYSIQHLKKNVD